MTTTPLAAGMRRLGLALFLVVSVAGCRTYGGYDQDDYLLDQIQAENRLFEEHLVRRQADLASIRQAAGSNTGVADFAARYDALLLVHEAILAQSRDLARELDDTDDYRALKRGLGAVVMEHRTMERLYSGLFTGVLQQDTAYAARQEHTPRDRYMIVPPFYARAGSQQTQPALAEVLRAAAMPARAGAPLMQQAPALVDSTGALPVDSTHVAPSAGEAGH